jgi:putative two-component system response regulator
MNARESAIEPDRAFKILGVDDDRSLRILYERLLGKLYQIELAASGEEALELAPRYQPDVVLLDIQMPGIDGYETCRRLKSMAALRQMQIIMISAASLQDEQVRAFRAGADDYVVKPIERHEFLARINLHYQLQKAKSGIDSIKSKIGRYQSENIRLALESAEELMSMQDIAVFSLAEVADSRDEVTGQHLLRMRAYSQILAEQLEEYGPYTHKIDGKFLDELYRSSPLHDIGKVAIPDAILLKPGPLTSAEFNLMKQHTVIGANILDRAMYHSRYGSFLAMTSIIARFHHERWDGTGYLAGLEGEEIPLPARIVALADVYDALTSTRPYHKPVSPQIAKMEITSESGRHFDPAVVAAFIDRFDDFLRIQEEYRLKERLAVGAMAFAPKTAGERNPFSQFSEWQYL